MAISKKTVIVGEDVEKLESFQKGRWACKVGSCTEIYLQGPHKVKASLVSQLVKNPRAMQETWVRSLGWEDPLEKGKATHFNILGWKIPWTL